MPCYVISARPACCLLTIFLSFGVTLGAFVATARRASAQGCIVARSNGEMGGPDSEGGYLTPGQFEFGIGYRHQYSFVHFVGPTEQRYRQQLGNQVENKINLENFFVTYQVSSRFSISADVLLLTASRHTNKSPIIYTSSGIGEGIKPAVLQWQLHHDDKRPGRAAKWRSKSHYVNAVQRCDRSIPARSGSCSSVHKGEGPGGVVWASYGRRSGAESVAGWRQSGISPAGLRHLA
jgi:hypothetical protein